MSDRASKAAELLTDFPLNIVPPPLVTKDNMSNMSIKDSMSMTNTANSKTEAMSEQSASPDSTTVSPVETGNI